jgi:hypothetical protein
MAVENPRNALNHAGNPRLAAGLRRCAEVLRPMILGIASLTFWSTNETGVERVADDLVAARDRSAALNPEGFLRGGASRQG